MIWEFPENLKHNVESFRQPFASMKDIVLLSMKRVSTLYLSYRAVINRLPLLAAGDLFLRILLFSQMVTGSRTWSAYLLVGAWMIFVMCSNLFVNHIITFVSCYVIIEKLLPYTTGDTIESTVLEMMKSNVINDQFSINLYKKIMVTLAVFSCFCAVAHTISLPVIVHGAFMYIALVVVSVSSLDVIQQKCEPILLETATSIGSLLKCGKILLIFFLLVVIPPYALYLVLTTWLQHLNMLWTMVIVTSWISTTINAIGSLLSFCLLIYDNYRLSPLDNLDDYIYYINLVTCSLRIVFGVFGTAALLWDTVMVEWVWLNILIFGLNFFHIYTSVTDKWQEYKRRRVAAKRLIFLPDATGEELERYNDDCAICLRPMTSAKRTPCNHYFHVACLKKWSYIRETCPMCNKKLNGVLTNEERIILQFLLRLRQNQA